MIHPPFLFDDIARQHRSASAHEVASAALSNEADLTSACSTQANSGGHTSAILRIRQVEARIGLRRSSIYSRLAPNSKQFDPSFPRPISLGAPKCRRSAVGWLEHEISAWLAQRSAARLDT